MEGDVLKIDFRMAIVSKIEAQDDDVECQHLILKSNVDIISLMSSYNKLGRYLTMGGEITSLRDFKRLLSV